MFHHFSRVAERPYCFDGPIFGAARGPGAPRLHWAVTSRGGQLKVSGQVTPKLPNVKWLYFTTPPVTSFIYLSIFPLALFVVVRLAF